MPEIEEKNQKDCKIILTNKKELCVMGVTEFVSATDRDVQLKINNEGFVVEGKNLTVTNLDTTRGLLELKGNVDTMGFSKAPNNTKFSFKKTYNEAYHLMNMIIAFKTKLK